MKIGVYIPVKYATSIKIYTEEILVRLERMGIEIHRFTDSDSVPLEVDLYWDSRCSGGGAPPSKLMFIKKPLVVTIHGVGDKFLPPQIAVNVNIKWYNKLRIQWRDKLLWLYFKNRIQSVITVSEYAKSEIEQYLKIQTTKITPIYHGVNKELFFIKEIKDQRDILLHISSYQPKKNVDRIIEAYKLIPEKERVPMKIVAPGYRKQVEIPQLEVIKNKISQQEAAELYRRARVFVFPSLHESFGMPLAEAMACGCPIITSNITACPEIVGEAGILVNPDSTQDICNAMLSIINDDNLVKELSTKSLERAKIYNWEISAEQHLKVFNSVLK